MLIVDTIFSLFFQHTFMQLNFFSGKINLDNHNQFDFRTWQSQFLLDTIVIKQQTLLFISMSTSKHQIVPRILQIRTKLTLSIAHSAFEIMKCCLFMNYFQAIHSLIVIKENHILKGQKFSKSIFYGAVSTKMNPKFVPEID